ncbi:MAG: ribonuclease III [Treponema sp.]|jgi:ribonuclease-3|nr:ribonuclease III [Treponema sp.]
MDSLFAGARVRPAPDPGRKKALTVFQKIAGVKFKNLELLNISLMHRSISNESGCKINNERLEFLGDAILGAVAATLLYKNLSQKPEGELAKIKSVVVSEDILSGIARVLQIDTVLLLGRGEELSGGRTKKGILADALEALIGALYLDSGYKTVFNFVSRCIGPEIDRVMDRDYRRDYKSVLQELSQRLFRTYPVYRMIKRSGPEHERLFWMEVTVNGQVYGPGMGRNKKSAEQEAAKIAWEKLKSEE